MESCTTSTPARIAQEDLLDPRHVDTCDRCGPSAKATFWVEMQDGRELTYCGHHGSKYKQELVKLARVVHDLTYVAMSR